MKGHRVTANSKGLRRDEGFTLIELLIALTIFAVGILAVSQMQVAAIQGIDRSGEGTVALQLGQDRLEQLLNLAYNDPNLVDANTANNSTLATALSTAGTGGASQFDGHQATVNTATGQYTIIWNVADNTVSTTQFKNVVVVVTWMRKGITHSCSLASIKMLAS